MHCAGTTVCFTVATDKAEPPPEPFRVTGHLRHQPMKQVDVSEREQMLSPEGLEVSFRELVKCTSSPGSCPS